MFEPSVRRISKGAPGGPVEPGLLVRIPVDRFGFILQCEIMREGTDFECGARMVEIARKKFPDLFAVGLERRCLDRVLSCCPTTSRG